MKILVVDDDIHIQQLVAIHLKREGYQVLTASDGNEALVILEDCEVDLAIVDVMMPHMNGYELTKILTAELQIPVILLTAKGQLSDKEKGFIAGSEDYIVKPFEPKELLFRVAVVLRRFERVMEARVEVGNVVIDRRSFEVIISGETMVWPLKEFELFSLLLSRAQKVVQRTVLIDQTWGEGYMGNEMTLNTHINRIRERLKQHHANVAIQTIRGIGYKLEVIE